MIFNWQLPKFKYILLIDLFQSAYSSFFVNILGKILRDLPLAHFKYLSFFECHYELRPFIEST